jgi:mannose-6-phosphate isomerase
LLIFEIQQNSDTTYRVFDWNRVGLDGSPRQLRVEESLQCIDFADVEPTMTEARGDLLVDCEHFNVQRRSVPAGVESMITEPGEFAIIAVVSGAITVGGGTFNNGDFFIIPACAPGARMFTSTVGGEVLITRLPRR